MITLLAIILLLVVLAIAILVLATGALVGFGWLIFIVLDILFAIWVISKLIGQKK